MGSHFKQPTRYFRMFSLCVTNDQVHFRVAKDIIFDDEPTRRRSKALRPVAPTIIKSTFVFVRGISVDRRVLGLPNSMTISNDDPSFCAFPVPVINFVLSRDLVDPSAAAGDALGRARVSITWAIVKREILLSATLPFQKRVLLRESRQQRPWYFHIFVES